MREQRNEFPIGLARTATLTGTGEQQVTSNRRPPSSANHRPRRPASGRPDTPAGATGLVADWFRGSSSAVSARVIRLTKRQLDGLPGGGDDVVDDALLLLADPPRPGNLHGGPGPLSQVSNPSKSVNPAAR